MSKGPILYRDKSIGIRLLPQDHQWIREHAFQADVSLGAFVRDIVAATIAKDRAEVAEDE